MNLSDIKQQSSEELLAAARELGVSNPEELRRQDLLFAVLRGYGRRKEEIRTEGLLEVLADGFGFLRAADAGYLPGPDDVYVSPSQIRRFHLRTGDTVRGLIRAPKESERYYALLRVESVNSRGPEGGEQGGESAAGADALRPDEALSLRLAGDPTGPLLELFSPLCRGQRCLVIAPPRSGTTTLLKNLARAVSQNHPDIETTLLLVDERPEEVAELGRDEGLEVIASTFDESPARHIQVADIAFEKAKRTAEGGGHALLLIDSMTRLVGAFNATAAPGGRLLGGDVDAGALLRAKKLFAAGRRLEGGGTLTVVAALQIKPAARFDEVVIEGLTNTATSTIALSAALRDELVFPAVDIVHTQSRSAEAAIGGDKLARAQALRNELARLDPPRAAERMRALFADL